jgi:CTP synthase
MAQRTSTIIITGGIVSGIGKGITSASLGRLFIDLGFSVVPVKADPYLNQDAGTMNPFQHGEVFVTDDGAETDLDLGHYERFLDVNLTQLSNFTSGSVYRAVMDQERDGEFLGKTIQIIPHVTEEIKRRIREAKRSLQPDYLLCEVGGTVGDIEALPFIEAVRQYAQEDRQTIFIHVVKMDYLYPSDEGKTKPIQHSVTALRSYGIQPDILIVRCKRPITKDEQEKIALFTGVPANRVIPALDSFSLYAIPEQLAKHGLIEAVLDAFNHTASTARVPVWEEMYKNIQASRKVLKIGLIGKYLEHSDAYLSVVEAIRHAGYAYRVKTDIVPVPADERCDTSILSTLNAAIVPGGFGIRGIEGKITCIRQLREQRIPFLGLCLGLQTAVIEYARHVADIPHATSTEFDPDTPEPVIEYLPGQSNMKRKGGTMRLGAYDAVLEKNSLVHRMYQHYRPQEVLHSSRSRLTVTERHRHRYEVNPRYHEALRKAGLVFSGMSPDGTLVEFIELPTTVHPYFIATQAHPEFRSRPHRPHPLFAGLIAATVGKLP